MTSGSPSSRGEERENAVTPAALPSLPGRRPGRRASRTYPPVERPALDRP